MAAMPGSSTEANTQDSSLVISDSVLAEIAFVEAMGTPGIVVAREGLLSGVLRRRRPRGVVADMSAAEVAFHLVVGVRDGACIPEAARDLRQRVAAAVTEKTGYAVRAVNVQVDHIVFDEGSARVG